MKVAMYSPWGNRWRDDFTREFEARGHETRWVDPRNPFPDGIPDLFFSMWADEWAVKAFRDLAGRCKLLTYIRSYEMYWHYPGLIPWKYVDAVFYCAPQVHDWCNQRWGKHLPKRQHVVLNWVDIDSIPLSEDHDPHKICMVASVNGKKGFDLAVQIMAKLPKAYTLDIAGEIQDALIGHYLEHIIVELGLQDRITFHGQLPMKDIPAFLADKGYILSTSLKEGCPMNIIEGMAAGVVPVVHNWAGAKEIFHEFPVWRTVDDAIITITERRRLYPLQIRKIAEQRFSLDNCKKVVDMALEAING